MYPIDEIKASSHWEPAKQLWAEGQYIKAVLEVFAFWPDITYPWRERAKDGTLLPRGEPSYNRLLEIAVEKWGNYNDLRNWKNIVWREFAHLQQGSIWFPLHYLGYLAIEYLFPGFGYIGFLTAWSFLVYSNAKKEFYSDVIGDGRLNAKNFIDFIVRLIPGIIFLIYIFTK